MAEHSNGGPAAGAGKRDRSPSFPYIGLTRAIERTDQLSSKAKRTEVRLADAAGAWKTGPKSSATQQTVAALLAFGLIEDSGSGDARKIRVSDLGRRILEDSRPGVRETALAEAALRPALIVEMARAWEGGRPDDAMCVSELKFDRGFTDEGARAFLRVYDDTVQYARSQKGYYPADKRVDGETDKSDKAAGEGHRQARVTVGDYVQWTNNGIDQFIIPARVAWISDDLAWLRVEGSLTGIPVSEVQTQPPPPPHGLGSPPPSALSDIKVLLDGDRLKITASVDLKGARKLLKVLEANMALLADEATEETTG